MPWLQKPLLEQTPEGSYMIRVTRSVSAVDQRTPFLTINCQICDAIVFPDNPRSTAFGVEIFLRRMQIERYLYGNLT
jgi:hypothetical protein